MKKLWLVMLLAFVLGMAGCTLPLEPRLQGISEFKPHGAREGTQAGITLGLDIENPNRYKIKVLAYDLDIFVNGKQVGKAEHNGKQVMAGMGTSTIRLDVATDIRQMFGGLLGVLGGCHLSKSK
jgi:LEA14-like dessication related protein